MADASDTLTIDVELALANARRDYEALKRDIESNPFKIDVALQGAKPEGGRSFGGGVTTLGPENFRRPDAQPQRPSMAQAMDSAMVQRNVLGGAIGGSGFGASVGPLPTAAVNSVYGGVSSSVALSPMEQAAVVAQSNRTSTSRNTVAHTDREYGAYRVRAVRSGIMDPLSRSAFDQEGGWQTAMGEIDFWNEQRARNRSDARMTQAAAAKNSAVAPAAAHSSVIDMPSSVTQRQFGPIMPNIRAGLTAYAGIQLAGAAFSSQTQLDYAQIGALGDRAGYARATIENNPLANMIGAVPFGIGGGIVSAADALSQGRIDAARTLRTSEIQEGVTGSLRQFGDARRQAGLNLQFSGAMAAGGFSARMAGLQMELASVEPNRQLRAAQMKAPMLEDVTSRIQERDRLQQNLPNRVYSNDPDSVAKKQYVDLDAIQRNADGGYDLSSLPFTPSKGAMEKLTEFNNAQAALAQARSRMNSADQATRDLAEKETKSIETSMRMALAFDKIDAFRIERTSALGNNAISLGLSGHSGISAMEGIRAQFQPQIAAAQRQIAAIEKEGGTVSEAQRAELAALIESGKVSMQRGMTSFAQSSFREFGGLRAAGLGLAYRPFDAMRAQADAEFQARTAKVNPDGTMGTMDPWSDEYKRAAAARDITKAQITQNENFQRRSLDTTLDATDTALTYRFGRNEIGAAAAEMVGGTINQIRELTRAGFYEQGEKLRSNTMTQLDLMGRDYALSFRATQYDAQNLLINNPRDSQNPENVFKSIADEKAKLDTAHPSPDKNTTTGESVGGSIASLERNLASIIKEAMQGMLAN